MGGGGYTNRLLVYRGGYIVTKHEGGCFIDRMVYVYSGSAY